MQLEALPSIPVVRRAWVCLFQTVKVRFLPELVVHPARLFPAQTVMAKHLLDLLSPLAEPAPVYLADPASSASSLQAQPQDSRQQPVMARQVARPRELAVECSLDSPF